MDKRKSDHLRVIEGGASLKAKSDEAFARAGLSFMTCEEPIQYSHLVSSNSIVVDGVTYERKQPIDVSFLPENDDPFPFNLS